MALIDKRTLRYIKEYRWSNVVEMIRNNRRSPDICEEDFTGKLVVISGATSGIGYATARKYASKGANILCINRNPEKSEKLKDEIEKEFNVKCNYIIADLSSIEQTHNASSKLLELTTAIDVLIHNAGVYFTRKQVTADGIEYLFMVHYLSSFIINYILKEKLKAQGNSRIILVSSEGYRFAAWGLRLDDLNWEKRRYSGLKSYGSAKLAQLLTMLLFDDYFRVSGVTINAMHPGAVKTDSGQENGKFYKWFKRNILDKALKPPDISADRIFK